MGLSAIIMMIVALVIIWGGLGLSLVLMVKRPLDDSPHPHDDHVYHG